MIAQAIAQVVDSYLTNSAKSREAASSSQTNLDTNIGTGKNENQLGGGGTQSNIPSDSGLSKTVHDVAGIIGAASKAGDGKGNNKNKDKTKTDAATENTSAPASDYLKKIGGRATGNVGVGGRPAQWGG